MRSGLSCQIFLSDELIMYFLTVNQTCKATIFGDQYDLDPISYPKVDLSNILVSDESRAIELLARHQSVLLRAEFDAERIPGFPAPVKGSPSELPENSRVIILRGGGIGDHLMLTPAIRTLKKALSKGSEIWLVSEKVSHCLFEGSPYVSRFISLPIRMSDLLEADYFIDFSSTQSMPKSLYKQMNLTDFYSYYLKIDPKTMEDKEPFISSNLTDSSDIKNIFDDIRSQNQERPIVLVQWLTSTPVRDVPPGLISALPKNFPDILFVVAHENKETIKTEKHINQYGLKVMNLSMHMNSLRDYVSAINRCDAVVSADTSAYHIAAALKKPGLALFGPIGSELRARYYPKIMSIDALFSGVTCESPCGLDRIWEDDVDERGELKKKRGCPEAEEKGTEYSPCLLSISERRLVEGFRKMISEALN